MAHIGLDLRNYDFYWLLRERIPDLAAMEDGEPITPDVLQSHLITLGYLGEHEVRPLETGTCALLGKIFRAFCLAIAYLFLFVFQGREAANRLFEVPPREIRFSFDSSRYTERVEAYNTDRLQRARQGNQNGKTFCREALQEAQAFVKAQFQELDSTHPLHPNNFIERLGDPKIFGILPHLMILKGMRDGYPECILNHQATRETQDKKQVKGEEVLEAYPKDLQDLQSDFRKIQPEATQSQVYEELLRDIFVFSLDDPERTSLTNPLSAQAAFLKPRLFGLAVLASTKNVNLDVCFEHGITKMQSV